MIDLKKESKEFSDYLIGVRRELHAHPEYGENLPWTRDFICKELASMDIPFRTNEHDSSIVASLQGKKPGKVLALRADIDALHIQEKTGLSFASQYEGLMHGCGHDAHGAIALAVLKILNAHRDELCGEFRVLFEAGEEVSSGSANIIAMGGMERVDAVYGIHVGNLAGKLPVGTISMIKGPVSAGKDKFKITIHGKGCHGAFPSHGIDPIRISAHVITALNEMYARELPSTGGSVFSFGSVHAGVDNNTIPETAELAGTIRNQNSDIREFVNRRMPELTKAIVTSYGATCDYELVRGSNPVVNDADFTQMAIEATEKAGFAVNTKTDEALMGSDDFWKLSSMVPGMYFFLSTGDVANHSPYFD
ncbi:MAG: M20 family metallopeptidase, partial [Sphaerochaetaceae bacterium]|nr:M20 family metallopeptidase [Sphaerochaetaceae bacterium]